MYIYITIIWKTGNRLSLGLIRTDLSDKNSSMQIWYVTNDKWKDFKISPNKRMYA